MGNHVRIGAGSVVLRDVPSDCTVVGVPGRIVYRQGANVNPLDHGRLPDSEAQAIRYLMDRIESLEQEIKALKQAPVTSDIPAMAAAHTQCHLRDKPIEQFLDGTGL